ncbi:MAG: DegT/DnrJ/EryC1/StrS family aminotransferase [Candidatus Omnitrophica bacterium]|nr:DegT/DnrJ/EryC1/StrS family aminotransferase [Candidatus Omnitrophota bacterium]
MFIRYDDMRIDRLLIKEYQKQLEIDLNRTRGLNDIDILLKEFEELFAKYIGAKYAIAVNSGTDALQLSLLGLGIGKGDSIIIPNVTYPAVPLGVIYTGAEPIMIDIKKEDLEINEQLIKKNIKNNTKAIIAVHMFARACNIEKISKIAKKYNLYVIEDCCQAESSEYKGKKLGSFGDMSCFSFSYYKPLSSCGGGGGMVCFNNEKYEKIRNYTNIWKDDDILLEAGKRFAKMYLLDLIAIKVKFRYLREIIKSRLKLKERYEEQLDKIRKVAIFKDSKDMLSIPQNFVIFSKERESLGEYLQKEGCVWQRPYVPLHLMKIFRKFLNNKFPVSNKYWNEAIQLPLFSFMKEGEVLQICEIIKTYYSPKNEYFKKTI